MEKKIFFFNPVLKYRYEKARFGRPPSIVPDAGVGEHSLRLVWVSFKKDANRQEKRKLKDTAGIYPIAKKTR